MTATKRTLTVRVAEVRELNAAVRELRLRSADGRALPGYSAGAHVRVQVELPEGEDWRDYSLINLSTERDTSVAVDEYRIAVLMEAQGRGGSHYMHRIKPGDELVLEVPKNDFMLAPEGRAVLVAGGIGVTPLLSMAAERSRSGAPWRMVYAGRSRELMAFLPELQAMAGDALELHVDAERGGPLDVEALLDGCSAQDRLYVCGPKPLLDAVLAASEARHWEAGRVHFELFTAPAPQAGDHAFELVLAQSGLTLTVPADRSILECLIDAGVDPLYDCQRGECGVCTVPVIEGEIDHRDYFLSDKEKASGKLMQVCVSRCRGDRLVLDL
jgi:vanillate O-demethylase ferredoxin subunit